MSEKYTYEEKIERLAQASHVLWRRVYVHHRDTVTPEQKAHRDQLALTAYEELPEEQKEKDREIARELLSHII